VGRLSPSATTHYLCELVDDDGTEGEEGLLGTIIGLLKGWTVEASGEAVKIVENCGTYGMYCRLVLLIGGVLLI
jgi:hypothetical protein